MKVKPISPAEVKPSIPGFIIETFNNLIQKNWDGIEAKVLQNEVLNIVASDSPLDARPSCQHILNNHWLDVEDIYRKAGWKVTYNKPAFYETYDDAYFLFRKR